MHPHITTIKFRNQEISGSVVLTWTAARLDGTAVKFLFSYHRETVPDVASHWNGVVEGAASDWGDAAESALCDAESALCQ